MSLEKWKKIGSAVVLAGKFGKKLIVQLFLNPKTGKEEEYVLFAQKDWSVIFAVTKDNQVLVVSEYKQGRDDVGDELPAGTANFEGESPETVAKRELREETGYESGEVIHLGSYWIATRSSTTKFHCFLAKDCEKVGPAKLDENEDIESRLEPLERWLMMIQDGRITEPSAVVATMRALPHLGFEII